MGLGTIDVGLILQGSTMKRNGIPNDILQNINPLCAIIFVPLMDSFVYPAFRRMGLKMLPITRLTMGFVLMAASMAYSAILQVIVSNAKLMIVTYLRHWSVFLQLY